MGKGVELTNESDNLVSCLELTWEDRTQDLIETEAFSLWFNSCLNLSPEMTRGIRQWYERKGQTIVSSVAWFAIFAYQLNDLIIHCSPLSSSSPSTISDLCQQEFTSLQPQCDWLSTDQTTGVEWIRVSDLTAKKESERVTWFWSHIGFCCRSESAIINPKV